MSVGFEAWTRVNITGVSGSRMAPRWAVGLLVGSVIVVLVAVAGMSSGQLRGALVFVGLWALVLLFMRTWFVATARVREYLVSRTDLGDWTRMGILAAVFLGIPMIGLVAGAVFLLGIQAIDVALH